ncbi:hypothetical protein HYDPIDRAFT_104573, partial [Hydnomerulius pinastri MD-312]
PWLKGCAGMAAEVEEFVSNLMVQPDREQVALEIGVLQSIYGNNAIHLWHSSRGGSPEHTPDRDPPSAGEKAEAIRYAVSSNLPSHEEVSIRSPQLRLRSRYTGALGVDSALFGSILRTFRSTSGVEWSPEAVCVYDRLQSVLQRCETWYEDRLNQDKAGELVG